MSIWVPAPEALDVLQVEETEGGFTLSAPAGTPCAAWLDYYSSTEELHEEFNTFLVDAIMEQVNHILEAHGSQEQDPERVPQDREQAQED